jgi:CHAT domain-containing protein/tetratricopeptide (TPR) repeat protein
VLSAACHSAPSPDDAYEAISAQAQQGDIPAALAAVDREYRRYASSQPDQAWRFRVLEGQLLIAAGKPGDALALVEEVPPASLAKSEIAARRKMVLGLARGYLGEYAQAESDLNESETMARPLSKRLLAQVLLSHGIVDVNEAKYGEADVRYHEALKIARDDNDNRMQARVLGNLGNVDMWEERYDEAVDSYRASLTLSRSSGAKDATSSVLGNLGWSYYMLGDFESALDYFQQAEQTAAAIGLERGQVEWWINIGDMRYQQRDFASAEEAYRKALALAQKIDYRTDAAECFDNLAQLELETGRIDSARQLNDQALALLRDKPDHFQSPHSLIMRGRIHDAEHDYAEAEQSFESVIHDEQAGAALHWEAGARLAKMLVDERKPQQAETEFRRSIGTIETARASVQSESLRLSFLSSAIEFYGDYIDFLVAQGRVNDALEVAELGRAHTLVASSDSAPGSFALPIKGFRPMETARRLHTIFLSYWLGNRKSYLWLVTPTQTKIFTLPPQAQLDPLVQAYRREMAGPLDPLSSQSQSGQKLYDALIAPAKSFMPKGSSVTILPDGSLYDLNFEALLCPDSQLHYWIDDAVVQYANSLVLLAGTSIEKPAKGASLLLIGNPVSPSQEFPDLPQARAEMQQVEEQFVPANREVFSGAQATPAAYLSSDVGKFSFIHFVAHGTASRTSPLDSAVILSKEGDSYKLYAREIVKQRLRANLVTISACRGAGSRTYSGEGMVGLSWAFLRAGAHGVIAALWDVNDNYTAEMMGRLYGGMGTGESPEVALHKAKLATVHSNSPYSKPFYWAAFQFYRGS